MRYNLSMIKTFSDKRSKRLYITGRAHGIDGILASRAIRKLDMIHAASAISDLEVPPGNRLEQLRGDRKGQWSIRVNDQWRICFRFSDGNAYDVEFCDYH